LEFAIVLRFWTLKVKLKMKNDFFIFFIRVSYYALETAAVLIFRILEVDFFRYL
jgi:hypothetical protein